MFHKLDDIGDLPVGGKAKGLKILKDIGLSVPEAFVIIHPNGQPIPEEKLRDHLAYLGEGPKAVRSSAVSEDGFHASFAGQFETYLNVSGEESIREAIRKCVTAAGSERVSTYSGNIHHKADKRISVIVQNMVDARLSGVIFTADPVRNRWDRVLVNAAEGIGEELVSGRKDSVQYELYRSGRNIPYQLRSKGNLLSEEQLWELLEGALKAEERYGYPVDLEWAIDHRGNLLWLQARPITTLDDVHFNELDDVKGPSHDVWSLGNIGEMMPGVVTPLSYSTSIRAIDIGLCWLWVSAGVFRMKNYREMRYIQMFYNRLFFNITNCMETVSKVAMNSRENVIFSLSAEDIPELTVRPYDHQVLRIIRFIRQISFIQLAHRYVKKLVRLADSYRIELTGDLLQDYQVLTDAIPAMQSAFRYHLGASAQSGYYYAFLAGILTENKRPVSAEDHHFFSLLLADNPDIESADAVKSLDRFADLIRQDRDFALSFTSLTPEYALELLKESAPTNIRESFSEFIRKHGHRCIRESELRENPWADDQQHLVSIIQATVRNGKAVKNQGDPASELERLMNSLNGTQRFIMKKMGKPARKAVVRREITKSASIRVVNIFRQAYRVFAKDLVRHGLLEDADQVYFLTHQEIGNLIMYRSPEWKLKAEKRRKQLPETAALAFPLMNPGIPEPIETETDADAPSDGLLRGLPVSSGIVEARARIVNTLEEAQLIEKGEIMVVSFTDIGWTPYFSMIHGLVTEIGSPLSHGAVVAREYGIPAVVSVKGARSRIRTGDRIRLNGNTGILEVLPFENL